MPAIAFYISGHGFGHAARDVEVVNAFARLRPDARILIRTAAPGWLFDLTLTAPVELSELECDTGVVQIDSLRLDPHETIRRASAFHATLDARADEQARALRGAGVSLVVGDVPPLAMAAAARADVPALALGNFTWDWIYSGYPESLSEARGLLETIRAAYRQASLALRLPMFGGFEVFGPRVRDVPFIARRSRFDREAARAALGIPADRPVVLLSFGGYGLASLDPAVLTAMPGYTFLLTGDPQAPNRGESPCPAPARNTKWGLSPFPPFPADPNVITIDEAAIYARGLRYEDLVAASDVVVTKPGYGIVADCVAHQAAVLYTSRGHFVEYDVIVAAMPRCLRCRYIGHEDLFAGRWAPHLDRLLAQPPPPERPRVDGADVVAGVLADYLE